jgi:O-antigen/teichoic acid export membrane protein
VATDLGRAAFLVLPALWLKSVEALLVGAVVFGAMRVGATLAVLGRAYRGALRAERTRLSEQLTYAMPFAAAVVVDTLVAQLHLYVVSNRFDAVTFAIYSVACFQVPVVDYLVTSASSVLMVQLGKSAGDPAAALRDWRATVTRLAALLCPLVAFLVVGGPDLVVLLFSARYAAAGPLFVLASLPIVLAALPTDAVLRSFADTRFLLRLGLVRLCVIAVSLPLLLIWLGLVGAILATVMAAVVVKVVATLRSRRHLAASLAELLPWRAIGAIGIASTAAASFTMIVIAAAAGTSVAARLVGGGAAFAVAYYLLGWRMGLFPGISQSLGTLARIASRRRAAVQTEP